MTTHYQALVRDVEDAQDIRAKFHDNDWTDAATRAHRRAFVLGQVLAYSSDIDQEKVKDRRDHWTPVMRGVLGQVVYVDVTCCRYKNGTTLMLVSWRVRQHDEPELFVFDDKTSQDWSVSVMTADDFIGFVTALTHR